MRLSPSFSAACVAVGPAGLPIGPATTEIENHELSTTFEIQR